MQGESGVGDTLGAGGPHTYTPRRFSSPHSMAAHGAEESDPAHTASFGSLWNARRRGRGSHTEGTRRRPSVPADAASGSSCDEATHPSSSDALLAHHLGRLRPSDSPQILPSERPGDDWASSSCEALPSLPGSPGWMRAREEVERAQPESMRPPRGPASATRRPSRGSHPPPPEHMACEPLHPPARRKSGSDAPYEGPWPKLYRVQSGDTSDEGSDTAPPMRSWRARPRTQRSPEHSGNNSEHSLSPVASSLELSELSSSEIQNNSASSGADGLDLLAEDMMIASDAVNEGVLQASSSTRSSLPSIPEDVLQVGDKIGPGLYHDGQVIQLAQTSEGFGAQLRSSIKCLEVVSLIGRGSYAAVYLARQVPCPPEVDACGDAEGSGRGSGGSCLIPTDLEASTPVNRRMDDASFGASMGRTPRASQMAHGESSDSEDEVRYKRQRPAREFAVKCLYKRDLSAEMLDIQRLEATIHQSIPAHPNIITLYLAYETNDWLMLVLEYCPGQDLYFWLEQAYDSDEELHYRRSRTSWTASESDADSDAHEDRASSAEVLTSPHLLGSTSPNTLLSYRRLGLVSRMFCQMCDAVQFCHDHGVSHRDIKPENFIVQESEHHQGPPCVKLTDFGLATTRAQCSDFGCGSKPYMAFECRHNLAATYDPRQADIWSLGIVLLNLIFRRSPFREPSRQCPSFAAFSVDPVGFLTQAFDGLTSSFACFLICNIFCDVSRGQRHRISAKDLSRWARGLPRYLARRDQPERGSRSARAEATSSAGSDCSMSMHSSFSENCYADPLPLSDRQALTNSATMSVSDQA